MKSTSLGLRKSALKTSSLTKISEINPGWKAWQNWSKNFRKTLKNKISKINQISFTIKTQIKHLDLLIWSGSIMSSWLHLWDPKGKAVIILLAWSIHLLLTEPEDSSRFPFVRKTQALSKWIPNFNQLTVRRCTLGDARKMAECWKGRKVFLELTYFQSKRWET